MALTLREIAFDCVDPEAVARFWGEGLGWEPHQHAGEPFWWLNESGRPDDFGMTLVFEAGGPPKAVKNRVHVDVSPRGTDQDTEVERLLALGATHVDIGQPADASWVVLADIEGNELCVLRDVVT